MYRYKRKAGSSKKSKYKKIMKNCPKIQSLVDTSYLEKWAIFVSVTAQYLKRGGMLDYIFSLLFHDLLFQFI